MIRACQKCGALDGAVECYPYNVLIAILCPDCINRTNARIRQHPIYQKATGLRYQIEFLYAQTEHDGKDRSDTAMFLHNRLQDLVPDALTAFEAWLKESA